MNIVTEEKIKPAHTHTLAGRVCFNISTKSTQFFIKHRILYYILQFTWGLPRTVFGGLLALIAFILKLCGLKVHFGKYFWIGYAKIGPDYWGGLDTGLFFFRDQKSVDFNLRSHEWGHTFQNLWLGPLFIFLVAIPSAIRWWIDWFKQKKTGKGIDYEAFWAEDAATVCGAWAVKVLQAKN